MTDPRFNLPPELVERITAALDRAMYMEPDPEEKAEIEALYDDLTALQAERSDGGDYDDA